MIDDMSSEAPARGYVLIHDEVVKGLLSLETSSIDLIITSPPYNQAASPSAQAHPNSSRGSKLDWQGYEEDEDCLPEGMYQMRQQTVLRALYRVARPGASLYYVHKDRLWDGRLISPLEWLGQSGWLVRQQIVWDRCGAYRFDGWHYAPMHEYVFWLTKGERVQNLGPAKSYTSIWRIPIETDPVHPAVFPRELVRRCLMGSGVKGGLVLDPYCGSGRAGAVALSLGMSFIGIDKQERYIQRARALLDEAMLGPVVTDLGRVTRAKQMELEIFSRP